MQNKNDENLERVEYVVRRKGKREGRPLTGKTKKLLCSIRIQQHHKDHVIKDHDTIQKWVDKNLLDEYGE